MLSFCLSLSFECSLWTLDLSPACHGQLEPHEILGEIVMFGGLLSKLCPSSPARWASPTCCILSLVSVIIVGTVRLLPLVLPRCQGPSCSARATPRLGEPCFQSPERPATWNSLHLEFWRPGPGDGKCKDNEDRQRECREAGCSSYMINDNSLNIHSNFETKFENDFHMRSHLANQVSRLTVKNGSRCTQNWVWIFCNPLNVWNIAVLIQYSDRFLYTKIYFKRQGFQ